MAGIVNTVTIGMDAVIQMLFGALLDMNWQGAEDSGGTRKYPSSAFCVAFALIPFLYAVSCLSCAYDIASQVVGKNAVHVDK